MEELELAYTTNKQALALHELGFPSKSIGICGLEDFPCSYIAPPKDWNGAWANNTGIQNPTLELVAKWLRAKKNFHIVINEDSVDKWSAYAHEIKPIEFTYVDRVRGFDSYDDALSACIDEVIKKMKSND